jgi:hypothetical protein
MKVGTGNHGQAASIKGQNREKKGKIFGELPKTERKGKPTDIMGALFLKLS